MFAANQLSDEQILRKIREGNQDMLVKLYERNFNTIRTYILRNNGQDADAEDVLQEALVILWQQAQKPEFTLSAKLDTFIFAIAKNLWLKILRKNNRITNQDFQEEKNSALYFSFTDANDGSQNQPEEERYKILYQYLKQLGETCKQILELFYFDGLDMEQIAVKLSFANAQTAKTKKYQCKKKLEEMIKKNYKIEDLL